MHDIDDSHAEVRFNARYKVNGRTHKMQENSLFVREQGAWLYVDGDCGYKLMGMDAKAACKHSVCVS